MDEDGSAQGGRTRLARGTKANARIDPRKSADGTDRRSSAPLQVDVAPHVDSRASGPVAAGLDSRGSGPVPAAGAPGSAGRAPAQSICEAVEQLIEAREADEAIAEWMQGGG